MAKRVRLAGSVNRANTEGTVRAQYILDAPLPFTLSILTLPAPPFLPPFSKKIHFIILIPPHTTLSFLAFTSNVVLILGMQEITRVFSDKTEMKYRLANEIRSVL